MSFGKPLIRTPDRANRELLRQDLAEFWSYMSPILVRAVEDSFLNPNTGKMRQYTRSEVDQRVAYAKDMVMTLRRQYKLSRQRIKDALPILLQAHVMKQDINLDDFLKRSGWVTQAKGPELTFDPVPPPAE